MEGYINANGVVTNYHLDTNKWYETKEDNEIIRIVDRNGENKTVNDLIVFSDIYDIYIQLIIYKNDGNPVEISDIIFINAGDMFGAGEIKVQGIKVIGSAGVKLRWHGSFY